MFRPLVLLSALLLAGFAAAQVGSVYSNKNLDAAVTAANAVLSSSNPDPTEAYLATRILAAAGKTGPTQSCGSLQAAADAAGTTVLSTAHALLAQKALGCLNSVSAAAVSKVQAGLESGIVADVYGATSVLPLLAGAKQELTVAWPSIVDEISALAQENGKFRDSKSKGAAASALNAGYGYAILAAAFPEVQGSPSSQRLIGAAQSLGELVNDAVTTDSGALELGSSEALPLFTTAVVLEGVAKLSAALGDAADVSLAADELAAFAALFLGAQQSTHVPTAAAVVIGLSSIASLPDAPLAIVPVTATLPDTASSSLLISVTDVLGKPVLGAAASLTVKSALRTADSKAVLSNQPATLTADKSVFSVDLKSPQAPGSYSFKVSVEPDSPKYKAVSDVVFQVKVLGQAVLTTATIIVTEGSKSSTLTATFPNAADGTLKLSPGSFLHVSLDVKSSSGAPLSPHQVFVKLSAPGSKTALFVASAEAAGSYRVSIDGSSRDALKAAVNGGVYSISVVVGDAILQNPTVWTIGKVDVTPPALLPQPEEILYTKPLLHDSDTTLKALPVIDHQFRQPDARAPIAVSSFFSLLAASPFLFLIYGLFAFGKANLSRIAEVNFLSFVGFVASLAAILGLLVVYWINLTMFDVLSYLILPSATAVWFGHRVLKALHAAGSKAKKD